MDANEVRCDCSPVCDTTFGGASGETPVEAVVEAVAAVEAVEPIELDPLYEAIDPDALNHLCATQTDSDGDPLEVQFSFQGWTIVVRGDETVQVLDPGPNC